MGSKTIRGIRFNYYPNDHDPPHIDAEIDGMKMKIYFGTINRPPSIGPMNPRIKRNDAKRAFEVFLENEQLLKKFYSEQRAKANK
jgi:hypothetical protein